MMDDYLLPLLLLVPILSAFAVLLPVPWFDSRKNVWTWSLASSCATLAIAVIAVCRFDWSGATEGMQLAGELPWVPGFNLTFGYGADAISMVLMLLTVGLMPAVILGSLTAVSERVREFYFWLLLIEAAMVGVFIATDIIFFYLCFEFTLIPLYFLIGVFGSTDRLRAAAMFFLYTFTGSMLTLAGVLYVVWYHSQTHALTFNIAALYPTAQALADVPATINLFFTQFTVSAQSLVLIALLAGFAVKVPIWPVHTWLPLAHTEAPTAGSVVLAGVLLKLGTYGLLRLALPMTPDAVVVFAPWIGVLAVIGIIYTALVCWVQKDIKKLIAYSSVSHLAFCVLGLFALDAQNIGGVGSVMYMVNHGLSTGALFLCIGMIYERFHTREMAQMSGLARTMPVWAFFMVFFVMASVGLPGLNGFVSEFLTLLGTFISPSNVLGVEFGIAAASGLILGAIYLLFMLGKVVWGPLKIPASHDSHTAGHHGADHVLPRDLNLREILTLAPLAVACVVLGLYPAPVLQSLEGPVSAMIHPARQVAMRQLQLVEQRKLDEQAADVAAAAAATPTLAVEPVRSSDDESFVVTLSTTLNTPAEPVAAQVVDLSVAPPASVEP